MSHTGYIWRFGSDSGNWVTTSASVSLSSDDSMKDLRNIWPFSYIDCEPIAFYIALAATGSVYGGLHLLAWNGPFPTAAERTLWRFSGFLIAAPLPLGLILLMVLFLAIMIYDAKPLLMWVCSPCRLLPTQSFVKLFKRICKNYPMRYLRDGITVVERVFSIIPKPSMNLAEPGPSTLFLISAFALVYLAARVYLVVECFINLAHLPAEVYKEPEWSNLIPHFGSG
jgi:hypothetical protein